MDWFDKNATALISAGAALSAALIAGVFTLLNNIYNNKRIEVQARKEEVKDNKRLYLEKGEELHGLLTKWVNGIHADFLVDQSYIAGKITLKQKFDITNDRPEKGVFERINALINIYFPHLSSSFEELRRNAIYAHDIVEAYRKEEIPSGEADKQHRKISSKFYRHHNEVMSKLQKILLQQLNS